MTLFADTISGALADPTDEDRIYRVHAALLRLSQRNPDAAARVIGHVMRLVVDHRPALPPDVADTFIRAVAHDMAAEAARRAAGAGEPLAPYGASLAALMDVLRSANPVLRAGIVSWSANLWHWRGRKEVPS